MILGREDWEAFLQPLWQSYSHRCWNKWWFSDISGQAHVPRSSVSSTENDINMRLAKAWMAIDRLSIIWKSDLSDEIKLNFFRVAVVSIILYGCTTWTLTERIEKKLDRNCKRMLGATLNKSWKQHPTKQQQYGHLPPMSRIIKIRQTRHAVHCWRSKDELISDIFLCIPSHGHASVDRPTRTYLQQLCTDTRCNIKDCK